MRITVRVPGALASCPQFKELMEHHARTDRDTGIWTLATALQNTPRTGHGAHHSYDLAFDDPAPAWSLRRVAAELLDNHKPSLTHAQFGAANKTLDRARNALQGWADATWPPNSTVGTPDGEQTVSHNLILAVSVRICTRADGTARSWTHTELQDWENQQQNIQA